MRPRVREVTSTVPFSFAKFGSKTNGRISVRSVRYFRKGMQRYRCHCYATMRWALLCATRSRESVTLERRPTVSSSSRPSSVRMRVEMAFRA